MKDPEQIKQAHLQRLKDRSAQRAKGVNPKPEISKPDHSGNGRITGTPGKLNATTS